MIVADAYETGGLSSWPGVVKAKVEILRAGCDMVLSTGDLERDVGNVLSALADGSLPQARLDDALVRVLGLRAALSLHRLDAAPKLERLAILGAKGRMPLPNEQTAGS